jgi:FkbM family methyltransferase
MRQKLRKFILSILNNYGYTLVKSPIYDTLVEKKKIAEEFLFLKDYPVSQYEDYFKYKKLTNSQLGQELFALMELKFKRGGYFVEFGATDGISLNNTYILEKEFDWSGILVEPSICWHKELISNRKAHIDKRCVWKESKQELLFKEVDNAILSTITGFGEDDAHSKRRENNKSYIVKSISLNDLLDFYNAPKTIDFLSIDTEGSEFVILESFDFSKYKFRTISVEHNFSENREKLYNLLTNVGYERVFEEFSYYDDWYKIKK